MIIIGDDWAQDHHDMELMSDDGDVLARFRVQEDADGLTELLTRIGEHVSDSDDDGHVLVGIERDNGPWVTALRSYRYVVYAINPVQYLCQEQVAITPHRDNVPGHHT